ncbi:MAG: inositol monophosphatase [Patescibacteria group bacterium]
MNQFSPPDFTRVEKIIKTAGIKLTQVLNRSEIKQKYSDTISSIVTQADIDTENFLRKELAKYFPTIGFYSEETYKSSQQELDKDFCWVVDPIDGTLNFSRGVPIFGISVALVHNNHPVFGAIYLPLLNEYFWAAKNSGAFLNDKPIHIRHNAQLDKLYGACVVGYGKDVYQRFIETRFRLKFESTHPYATVFNYAHTAAGNFDFSLSLGPALWDIAAGWILIEEAGGIFETFHIDEERKRKGDPYHLWCIAGEKQVVDFLLPKLKLITK